MAGTASPRSGPDSIPRPRAPSSPPKNSCRSIGGTISAGLIASTTIRWEGKCWPRNMEVMGNPRGDAPPPKSRLSGFPDTGDRTGSSFLPDPDCLRSTVPGPSLLSMARGIAIRCPRPDTRWYSSPGPGPAGDPPTRRSPMDSRDAGAIQAAPNTGPSAWRRDRTDRSTSPMISAVACGAWCTSVGRSVNSGSLFTVHGSRCSNDPHNPIADQVPHYRYAQSHPEQVQAAADHPPPGEEAPGSANAEVGEHRDRKRGPDGCRASTQEERSDRNERSECRSHPGDPSFPDRSAGRRADLELLPNLFLQGLLRIGHDRGGQLGRLSGRDPLGLVDQRQLLALELRHEPDLFPLHRDFVLEHLALALGREIAG